MATIGFVGLGIMGRPMVNNLLKAGHTVVVFSRSSDKVAASVADGAQAAKSNADAGRRAGIIITMLPDGPEVEAVILGSDGILSGAAAGSLIVDMSSINPLVSQKIAAACKAKGVHFLDAPVSGGEPKAVEGTLAIMVGGAVSDFERAKPILLALGSSVVRIGDIGAGNVAKLANQIIVACNIAAMGEGIALARHCGLDAEVVINAIKGGLAGSTVLNAKGPMLVKGDFKPGFKIRLHQKDLRNAMQTAEAGGIPLPLTALVQQMMLSMLSQGKGELDHSALATFTEGLMKGD